MADEFIYTNYSVEDIERYLGGRMSAKDMHDMERAALQDPFLADAIEGFQHQPFAQTYTHLDEIAAAIQGEKESAKIVPLPVKHNYWWRVAAAIGFVIIGGATLWYIQSNNKVESKTIAAATPEKPPFKQAPPLNRVATSDTVSTSTTANLEKRAIPTQTLVSSQRSQADKQTFIKHAPTVVVTGYGAVKADSIVVPVPVVEAANTRATEVLKQIPSVDVDANGNIKFNKDTALDKKLAGVVAGVNMVNAYTNNVPIKRTGPTDNELNLAVNNMNISNNAMLKNVVVSNNIIATTPAGFVGFVVDDKNQPVANVTVYSNDKKHITLTDSKGFFVINTRDSQLAVQVSSAGYYPKQVQLNANTPSYITINQETAALAGVEVVEFKNSHPAKKMPADSLFPEGGWPSFREYVYKKLHKEKEMDTSAAEITGLGHSVEIEFVVDENGLAQDLKIIKSLNDDSDKKALEVVQQWPHWVATKKDRKGKVVIQF